MSKNKSYKLLMDLKIYFEETPIEEIQKDWDKTKELDNVGPTVEEFSKQINKHEIFKNPKQR